MLVRDEHWEGALDTDGQWASAPPADEADAQDFWWYADDEEFRGRHRAPRSIVPRRGRLLMLSLVAAAGVLVIAAHLGGGSTPSGTGDTPGYGGGWSGGTGGATSAVVHDAVHIRTLRH